MPQTTPEIKVQAVRGMGAEVVQVGDDYTAAQRHAEALCAERGLEFVHPFDDPLVMAGQGTIADELRRQSHGRMSVVFVPVGGGGLIAGIAGYVKTLMPEVRVIGVEPFDSDAMYQSLAAGRRVTLDHVGVFADGTAVHRVGALTFAIVKDLVDEVVRVSNDEICAAIGPRVITEFNYRLSGRDQAHIFVGVRTTSREDAAALGERLTRQGYDTVDLSDDELAKLHVRHMVGGRAADVRQERACRFEFPDRSGALMEFLETLSGRWNISLFHYRNHGADFGRVLAAFEVPDDELTAFEAFLAGLGYYYELQTGDVAYEMFLA